MHRIKRPQEPDAFLEYRLQNPAERNWDTFSSMTAYHEARKALFHNQDGLCAYCEARLPWDEEHGEPKAGRMRIEHFHAYFACANILSAMDGFYPFQFPHYPAKGLNFRFGISWRFYD